LLRGVSPSKALIEKTFPENLYFAYRETNRKLQYHIEDWDFRQAKPELLTQRQRDLMHTVALGETSGAAVGDGFLRSFRTMPELAAFFGTWFVEELNHFFGYHFYLEIMGERWPDEKGLDVARVEFEPYSKDPYEVAACNMYQELLGYLIYRQFGKQVRDPFLSKMLTQFAKDELRHYKFYQNVVARKIQQDPDFRAVVLKTFLKATSPFNQMPGGVNDVINNLKKGSFYFRKAEFDFFLDQVEFLIGDRMETFFAWFFKDLLPECETCDKQPYLCECEVLEPNAKPVGKPAQPSTLWHPPANMQAA
ncbi:MAG: acyl-ACP desaturase, partial [Myxococcaceae bacterium]